MRIFLLPVFFLTLSSFGQTIFTSLDSLMAYASATSKTAQSNSIEARKAKEAKLAAVIGIIDPIASSSLSFTNNTQLPVSLFPGEILGGQPGTFQEVQTGVQYNTSLVQNIDIKLLNLSGWENLKLAKLNIELTDLNNQTSMKSLHENIAANYYTIISLQEQLKSTEYNLAVSDTLYQIAVNKYEAGLVNQQDVNDTKVSLLTTKENVNQINFLITQYYTSLSILCDIPENQAIAIKESISIEKNILIETEKSMLSLQSSLVQLDYAKSNFNQIKKSNLPSLSLYGNYSHQLFNTDFSVFGGDWIPSNYIGLKLAVNLPSADLISRKANAKFDYQLAQVNVEKERIHLDLNQKQLDNDYQKALSQYRSNEQISTLRKDTYEKNKNLYQEGLLGIDQTLNSFNAMVNADYNVVASMSDVLLAKAKIQLNNKYSGL